MKCFFLPRSFTRLDVENNLGRFMRWGRRGRPGGGVTVSIQQGTEVEELKMLRSSVRGTRTGEDQSWGQRWRLKSLDVKDRKTRRRRLDTKLWIFHRLPFAPVSSGDPSAPGVNSSLEERETCEERRRRLILPTHAVVDRHFPYRGRRKGWTHCSLLNHLS